MAPVRFEPTISVGERLQTYALDRAATGTGIYNGRVITLQVIMCCISLTQMAGFRWKTGFDSRSVM